jgi:hypothetical protein
MRRIALGALQGQLLGLPHLTRCQGLANRLHEILGRAGGDGQVCWSVRRVWTRRGPGLLVAEHAHGVRDQGLRGRISAAR